AKNRAASDISALAPPLALAPRCHESTCPLRRTKSSVAGTLMSPLSSGVMRHPASTTKNSKHMTPPARSDSPAVLPTPPVPDANLLQNALDVLGASPLFFSSGQAHLARDVPSQLEQAVGRKPVGEAVGPAGLNHRLDRTIDAAGCLWHRGQQPCRLLGPRDSI